MHSQQAQQHDDEEKAKKSFTIPTVKVPLLKVPLTKRPDRISVIDHFKPAPPLPGETHW